MKSNLTCFIAISLFLGFVFGGGLLSTIFPSTLRVTKPLVCQGEMEINIREYSVRPGEVSTQNTVWCYDASGGKKDITLLAAFVASLIGSGIIFLLFCLNALVKRLRGGPAETEAAPAAAAPPFISAQPTPARPVDLTGDDPTALLQKLKEMRQADLITEQEYEAKKAEILKKM